jgi:hypothetical protein
MSNQLLGEDVDAEQHAFIQFIVNCARLHESTCFNFEAAAIADYDAPRQQVGVLGR